MSAFHDLSAKNVQATLARDDASKNYLRFAINVNEDIGPSSSGKTVLLGQFNGEVFEGSNLRVNFLIFRAVNVTADKIVNALRHQFRGGKSDSVPAGEKRVPEKGHGFFINGSPEDHMLFLDVPFDILEKVSTNTDIDTVAPMSGSGKSRVVASSGGIAKIDELYVSINFNMFVVVNKMLNLDVIARNLNLSSYELPKASVVETKRKSPKKETLDLSLTNMPLDPNFVSKYLEKEIDSTYNKETVEMILTELNGIEVSENAITHAIAEYYLNHIRNEVYLKTVVEAHLKKGEMPAPSAPENVLTMVIDAIKSDIHDSMKSQKRLREESN